jgi:hypothetical protein
MEIMRAGRPTWLRWWPAGLAWTLWASVLGLAAGAWLGGPNTASVAEPPDRSRPPPSSRKLASEPTGEEEQHQRWQITSIHAMGFGQRDQHGPLGERFRDQHAGGHGHQGKGQDSPASLSRPRSRHWVR